MNPETSRVRWDLVQLHPEVEHVQLQHGVTHDTHVAHPMGCSLRTSWATTRQSSTTIDGAGYCVEGNSLREKDSAIPPSEE